MGTAASRHPLAAQSPTLVAFQNQRPNMLRRHLLKPLLGVPLALLGACAWMRDIDHDGPDAPSAAPLANAPRTAWVFSSGGPRGFAHVGVLKALAELGLRPDLVLGASIGSLVACLYASGMAPAKIETLAMEFSTLGVVRPHLGSGSEKISAAGMVDLVNGLLGQRRLEQLTIPVAVVAMRPASRELVAFTRGDAGVAIQASCAIEGTLAPVLIHGLAHADPDLVAPLPVRLALALGARRVLAVDVSAHEDKSPPGSERFRAGDLRKRALTEPDARAATLTLHPEFSYYVNLSQAFRETVIRAGYEQTLAQAAALRAAFPDG
jgi:NTE family protein